MIRPALKLRNARPQRKREPLVRVALLPEQAMALWALGYFGLRCDGTPDRFNLILERLAHDDLEGLSILDGQDGLDILEAAIDRLVARARAH